MKREGSVGASRSISDADDVQMDVEFSSPGKGTYSAGMVERSTTVLVME